MLGQSKRATGVISDAADRIAPYFDRLAHDKKLRRRLAAAIGGAVAERERAGKQRAGFLGTAGRIVSDPARRAPLFEAVSQLHKARGRMKKTSNHRTRNSVLAVAGAGIVVAVVPKLRNILPEAVQCRGSSDDSGSSGRGIGLVE